jgi:hypothetical protein
MKLQMMVLLAVQSLWMPHLQNPAKASRESSAYSDEAGAMVCLDKTHHYKNLVQLQ